MTAGAIRGSLRQVWGQPGYAAAVATGYGQVATSAVLQLLLIPLYLAHLDTYTFGVLMMLLSFVNFASFGVGWMSGGMQRLFGEAYAARDERRFLEVFAVSKSVLVGYALALGALAAAASPLLAERVFNAEPLQRDAVVEGIVATAIYIVVLYAFNVDRIALTASGRQASANVLFIVKQAVSAILVVAVLLFGGGLFYLLLCYALGAAVALVAARWRWSQSELRPVWLVRPQDAHRRVLRRLTGRMGIGYLWVGMVTLALQADALILGLIGGPESVAEFIVVWRLAELAMVALWRLPDTLQPFVVHFDARREGAKLQDSYRLMTVVTGAAALTAGLLYAFLGPTVVGWWVGVEKVPQSIWPYALAGGAMFWLCLARTPVSFAYSVVKLRPLAALQTLELCAKVALLVWLYPRFGYLALLIAINVVHGLGLAPAYQYLGAKAGGLYNGR